MAEPSRRSLLVAGGIGLGAVATGGLGLVEAAVLPGKGRLDHVLGQCGDVPRTPAGRPATVAAETFGSRRRGREVDMVVVRPAGGAVSGVVIALHGYGDSARGLVGNLALDRYLGVAAAARVPPFALVAVDGGNTYWHRRAAGDDPVGMITEEVLPRLAQRGFRTDRIGVIGWSMGGYGALLIGQTLGPGRVRAVVASSPALFAGYDDARGASPEAFDNAADFARNDVIKAAGAVPTWVDCGSSDPFAAMARQLRARLATIRPTPGEISAGCHDAAYWRRRLPAQLAFLGAKMAEA